MERIAKIAIIAGIAKIEERWVRRFSITRLPNSGNYQSSLMERIAIIAGIAKIEKRWRRRFSITRLPDSGNYQSSL